MSSQENIKRFKRAVARNCLFATTWLYKILPYGVVKFFMKAFIFIGFSLTIRQRQIAYESLEVAFKGEKSDKEIEQIWRNCFSNLGKGMMELVYFMNHPHMIKDQVMIEGQEHLDRALAQGKGVIAVSAHFGNFPLMLLKFAQDGIKTNAIIRPARDQIIEKHFLKQRTSLGLNTIYSHPRKECVSQSIKLLRNNELLFIPLDQNFGSGGGVFVEFFGHKAATATGPVVFAKRTQAPILPMFVVRQDDDRHKVIIEPPIEFEDRDNDKEMIFINTSKITQLIEKYIRQYPQEWGWMHRRWKSKPPEVASSVKS